MDQHDDDDSRYDGIDEDQAARRLRVGLWRKLFSYTGPYRRELGVLAVCAVLTAACDVSFTLITRAAIDEAEQTGVNADLLRYGWLYLLNIFVISLGIGAFIWSTGKLRIHISHDIRRDGFENLQRLSFSYYDHRPVGWLMARMTSDCDRLANILAWGILDLVWGLTMMLGIAGAMLVMNYKLALAVLSVIPALAWVSGYFQKRILRSARETRKANSRITGAFNEGIMGVITSKAFVRESDDLRDFQRLTTRMFDASIENQVQAALYVPLVLTLGSLALGMVLVLGGVDLSVGAISAGTLIAFLAYSRQFFDPVEQLGRWFAEMQMAQASAERILGLVEARADISDDADVRSAIELQGRASATEQDAAPDGGDAGIHRIELQHVSFAYEPDKPVLSDVSFSVSAGETVAIVGPTGGGKSTLVNLICRFYEPTSGQVLIDGVDYRRRSLHWLQSSLGIVLQTSHVFSGSIRENIRFGKLGASDTEIEEAAALAGALPFIEDLPSGFSYDVGESGNRLSAGQKQLISFARAILADPQILVMDEATSSVDTETEQHIQRGLANVLRGRIAFVIAHRLSTIRNANRILVIEHGRLTEQGSHEELIARRGHYFELYRQQSLQASTADWQRDEAPLQAGQSLDF